MNVRQFITLVAAAVVTTAGLASAQNLVDRSGATDANNRLGSNGRNSVVNKPNPWDVSNAIVYGNVTGGKQFRGNVQSTDPLAFRDFTGNRTQDDFVRDSSGVTTNGIPSFNASQTRSYYGDSRAVPPPAGYVGIPGSGGYTPPAPEQWTTFDPRQQPLSAQVSTSTLNNGISDPGIATFAYNQNGLPITPALAPGQLNPSALSDYTNLNQGTLGSQLTTAQLTRLRQEIGQGQDSAQDNGSQPANKLPGADTSDMNGQNMPDTRLNNQVDTGGPVTSAELSNNAPSDAVSNAVSPTQTAEPGLVTKLAGASDTSTNAANQTNATNQPQRPGDAAAQAADQFNTQLRARKAAEDKAKNADQPGANGTKLPAGTNPPVSPTATNLKAPPTAIQSLAGSTRAKGLNELLAKAEDQMRQGKFASAIDTYDAAQSVEPSNPLIKLGQANAELGGAYYRRAEATIRQLSPADRKVLAGRYDLRAFIGDDRLQLVQKDLSDLIEKNPNDTGSAILLAYVYYNTGNDRRAIALLDLADKRASGKDALIAFLKQAWTPSTETK